MTRHDSTRALARAAAVAAALLLASLPAGATNYLIVIADDLGVDKVGAYSVDYGGFPGATHVPTTPTIDLLASTGLRFTRAWANPVCSPSRAALLTGKHAFRTGVSTALSGPAAGVDPDEHLMLGRAFQDRGFATGYFGKWHIGREDAAGSTALPTFVPPSTFTDAPHPSRAGWQRFFGNLDGDIGDYWNWERMGWLSSGIGYAAMETTHATERTADVALSWISSRSQDWIAVLSFNAPHAASGAAGWFYGDADTSRVYDAALAACLAASSCADEARSVYRGLAEQMDHALGDLLNAMDPAELDDTVIVFLGDNGTPHQVQEGDFASPVRGKSTGFENGVRVPLIITDGVTYRTGAAGSTIVSPGRTTDVGVHVRDIYQTLMELEFGEAISGLDSREFTQCFTNTTTQYCGYTAPRYDYAEKTNVVAVRYGHDKMVAEWDAVAGCLAPEFYDTSSDPLEGSPYLNWPAGDPDPRTFFEGIHAFDMESWAYGLTICP